MNFLLIFITIFFIAYKIESSKIRPNFDEIFGGEWDKSEFEGKVIKIEQKENSKSVTVDQAGEEMGTYPIDQINEYSNQNVIKNDQNMRAEPNDQQKRKMINKFEAIKDKLKQKRKYKWKNNSKIERKIGKLLGVGRHKIYKWKKELNFYKMKINRMQNNFYEEKKKEFIERINEFKSLYGQGKQKEFVKELGISVVTFWKWKKELLPKYNKTPYSNEEKLQKMKQYFKIKEKNPKINDGIIAKQLEIGSDTLRKWKKKFASISGK